MPHDIPSHYTFNDVLNRFNPNEFDKAFTHWVNQLMNAWSVGRSVENNICLGQIKESDKSNEITAIPKL
jgi:hypothetical protein